ncbi:TonB-dependent receptor [Photobacterium toruni]|uniref:TonB-dependent receptor n=1 Tax=Photobacterium toruni TaxID=1935446 RepID=A0ABU6L8A4_9GAMM|nr:TonB-dependent receptor [Photobacterium toruni]
MKKSLLAATVASLCLPSFASFAADTTSDDVMVVTANRFEQAQADVITPITVVTRDDIELEQAKSLTDILRNVPGVQIGKSGGRGQATSVFMRGFNSGDTLILLNGLKLNSVSAGGYDLSTIPAAIIERIDVIRGPRAAMYGSDAIAGVINIITVPESDVTTHQLFGGIGGDNYSQIGWRSSGKLNQNTFGYLSLNREHTDGYAVKVGRPKNERLGYEVKSLTGGLSHQFSDTVSGNLQLVYNDGYSEFDSNGVNTTDLESYQYAGNLKYQSDSLNSIFTLGHNKDNTYNYPNWPARYITLRDNASWVNSLSVNNNLQLNSGIDWIKESIKGSSTSYVKDSRINKGLFFSSQGNIKNFKLDSSIRLDDNSSYGDKVTWNLAMAYQLLPSMSVFASHGTGFKAPTFNDLYTEGSGNPDLKPQNSQSTQLGLKGHTGDLNWQLVGYHSIIDDMIIWYNPTDITGSWFVDNTDADIKGAEFIVGLDTDSFSHSFNINYTDAQDDMGHQLARRAKWNANWSSTYFYNDIWDTTLQLNYLGKRYSDPSNHITLPSVVLANIAVNYNVTSAWQVSARIDNLFNKEYQTVDTYRGQERIGFLNTKYKF